MKRYFYIVLIFLLGFGFYVIYYGNNTTGATSSLDINKLENAVNKVDGRIVDWSLYARENLNISTDKGFAKFIKNIQSKFPDFKWQEKVKSDGTIVVGHFQHAHGEETIKFESTHTNGTTFSYVVYSIQGDKGLSTKDTKYIVDQYIPNIDEIFTNKPIIFSCIKGEINDRLDKVLSGQAVELLAELDAKQIESLEEKDFYSISAYSEEITQAIPTETEDMNIQLGLRDNGLGAKTTFVIGTPILTIEY
jgi:hypothetical protein